MFIFNPPHLKHNYWKEVCSGWEHKFQSVANLNRNRSKFTFPIYKTGSSRVIISKSCFKDWWYSA